MLSHLLLVALLLIFSVFAGETSDIIVERDVDPSEVDYKNATNVVLKNIKIREIPKHYFRNLKVDLSFLGITDSKLVRIDEEAFDGLNHLNLLELSRDEISEILPRTFAPLKGLELLQLRSNRLRRVSLVLGNVQEIVLANNQIDYLQKDFIVGGSVTFVDLRWNRLTNLNNSMKSLDKLSTINLANNRIYNIEPEVFAGNEYLVTVNASGNFLTSTKGLKLKQLLSLDLSSNHIHTLDNESLSGMSFLNNLLLNDNQIVLIDNAFADLKNLQYLDLSENEITFVDPGLFSNNQYLYKLRLSNNQITRLKPFSGQLTHLTVLDLSHNGLASIEVDFFKSMTKLEILDLSFNKLKAVGGLLHPLTELATLDLSNNQIAFGGNETVSNVNLKKLNLSSNGLELGLSDLRRNRKLTQLDVSRNEISNFCDTEFDFEYLTFMDLSRNRIRELNCMKRNSLPAYSLIDIRRNPLTCDSNMDDVISHFVQMQAFPYAAEAADVGNLLSSDQGAGTTLKAWNSAKHELCPDGLDIHIETLSDSGEGEKDDPQQEKENERQRWDYALLTPVADAADHAERASVVEEKLELDVELEMKSADVDTEEISTERKEQSERRSWNGIGEADNVVQEYEDGETNVYQVIGTSPALFTMSMMFIGISLILVLLNVAFCMCVRLRGWRRDMRNMQKYTHLENRVYKNTTIPNEYNDNIVRIPKEQYRINCAKILKNFGLKMEDEDNDSVRKMIVDGGLKTDV